MAVTGAAAPQAFLASALSIVVGEEALPGFLSDLGSHVKREVEEKEAALGPLWDEADRHENICRGEFCHRIVDIAPEAKGPNKPQLTIFKKSNKSLNIVRAMVRFLTAKAYDEFFGTEPWASFRPQQAVDGVTAEAVGRWGRWKMDQEGSGFEPAARQAIRSAFGTGITVMKIQRVRMARRHAEFVQALVGADGQPVLTDEGKPVTADDERPVMGPVDPLAPDVPPTKTGQVQWETLPGLMMAEGEANYAPHVVQKEIVTYDGPQTKLLFYRNFLCDPKIPGLDAQPFMGDTYEIRVGELKRLYSEGLLTPEAFSGAINAATNVSEDKARVERDGETTGREHWATLPINDFVRVAECELDYEVPWSATDGTGTPTSQLARLWCVVAVNTGQVIWADFLGNITPQGQTHYVSVTSDSDETRLFGISLPHKYEDAGDFIDATVNQVVYRNDFAANPAVSHDPQDFIQTKDGKPLEFKPGMSLAKTSRAADKKLEELIEIIQLPQMEDISEYLIDLFMKTVQTDGGVTGAAQGDTGALPSTSTATGVRSILGFGSVLHKLPMREIKSGLERAIRKFFDFALFRPAGDEFYNYFEGDQQRVEVMTAATRRQLKLDVSLSLSRFADSERTSAEQQSLAISKDYLQQLPEVQQALRPLYVRVLSNMGIPEAEKDLPMPGMVSTPPMGPPGAGGGGMPPAGMGPPPTPTAADGAPGAMEEAP